MKNGLIAVVFGKSVGLLLYKHKMKKLICVLVFALATATHLPDCTRFTRFPPGGCAAAASSLVTARQYQALGPSGKVSLSIEDLSGIY